MSRVWKGITEDDTKSIIKLMTSNLPVIVSCPTGSGKSTILVKAFEEAGAKIFITEPTIPAVGNLYEQMEKTYGKKVGKASDSEIQYNSDTKIVYCTAGHLKRKLMSYFIKGVPKAWDFCSVLMIDEAHNGSLDNDILISLWRYAMNSGVKVPRLVLASATIDIESFSFRTSIYRVEIPDSYKVEIFYHDNNFKPEDKQLYPTTAFVINKFHMENPMKETDSACIWLAYAAGSKEVDIIANGVIELAPVGSIEVLTEHSKLDPAERRKIFEPVPIGKRRLIVATNSAESSITINNLSGIFDTLTEKFSNTSTSGGLRLTLGNISKASADQRKGRTGRTCDGFCYRMCTREYYEKLEIKREKEIFRIPIHDTIIEVLSMGLDPRKLFDKQIEPARLDSSIQLLLSLKMIYADTKGVAGLNVSDCGRLAAKLPLSVYSSACLYEWQEKRLPMFPGIVIMSIIDKYDSFYYYPKKTSDMSDMDYKATRDAHYEKYFKDYEAEHDLEILIKLWGNLMEVFDGPWAEKSLVREVCAKKSLNAKKIREILKVVVQIMEIFGLSDDDIGPFLGKDALKFLSPILTKIFSSQILSLQPRGSYLDIKTRDEYTLDNKLVLKPQSLKKLSSIIVLSKTEIEVSKGRLIRIISLSHPIKY